MREQTIGSYLDDLAAKIPAPGGGAAAALHAAQGAALVEMVANYTSGPKYAAHAEQITEIRKLAADHRSRALELAVEDAEAFSKVAAAYQLPKDTAERKALRSTAIQEATIGAARPPADTIGVAAGVVLLAQRLLPIANRNVISDIAAAADAARAAASTGLVNVEINLTAIKDETITERLRANIVGAESLLREADELVAAVRTSIREGNR